MKLLGRLAVAGLLGVCAAVPLSAPAVERIQVMALFPGKAMVRIDGRNRLLRLGEVSPEGVRLVSADARSAVIEVDGKRQDYPLGRHAGGVFVSPETREVRIWRDHQGAYRTVGSINGRNVDLLVDTGASTVAMSENEARRLGIPYRLRGRKVGVNTASGVARAHAVTLDRVRVGEIELHQVEAVVIEGDSPRPVLLGMSFLRRVNLEKEGNLLRLRSKF